VSTMTSGRFWLGALLVVAGVSWLLADMDLLRLRGFVIAAMFAVVGLGFGYVAARNDEHWWAWIPAGALIGLSVPIALQDLAPSLRDELGAGALMAGLGLGFLVIALRQPTHWWAIIPGGVLASIAAMIASRAAVNDIAAVAVLFAGFTLTFGVVAAVRTNGHRMRWALVPAGIFAILALSFGFQATRAFEVFELAWPAAIILLGVALLWREGTRRRQPDP